MAVKIDIEKIEIPQGLLPRLFGVNEDTVEEYMNAIQMGEKFPPIEVWAKDNGVYWIVDGVHRYTAYKRLGYKQVEAKVLAISDLTDFIELATLANLKHGLQLTKDDKRHVARMLYSRGKNLKQIENLLKVPERTLYRWTQDLRDEKEREKEKQKQEAIRLYNEGYTQQEIADLLGVPQQTISDWIRAGLPNSAKWQKSVKEEPPTPTQPTYTPEEETEEPEEPTTNYDGLLDPYAVAREIMAGYEEEEETETEEPQEEKKKVKKSNGGRGKDTSKFDMLEQKGHHSLAPITHILWIKSRFGEEYALNLLKAVSYCVMKNVPPPDRDTFLKQVEEDFYGQFVEIIFKENQ